MTGTLFEDRRAAGRKLALQLEAYRDALVLALPRGGVPVAYEVALALGAPLEVFTVRKLGAPGQPELALGAVASGGVRVLNEDLVTQLGISEETIERLAEREQRELARREALYRDRRPQHELAGRSLIVVDDGLATGASMRAAVRALKTKKPAQLTVAVPVAAAETCAALGLEVDAIVCAATPSPFRGVGRWYAEFGQTSDDEVVSLLKAARRRGS